MARPRRRRAPRVSRNAASASRKAHPRQKESQLEQQGPCVGDDYGRRTEVETCRDSNAATQLKPTPRSLRAVPPHRVEEIFDIEQAEHRLRAVYRLSGDHESPTTPILVVMHRYQRHRHHHYSRRPLPTERTPRSLQIFADESLMHARESGEG